VKAIIQVSFYVEVDDEEEAYQFAEEANRGVLINMESVMEQHGVSLKDLDGRFEYLGPHVLIAKTL
jgi:hypothetical protein